MLRIKIKDNQFLFDEVDDYFLILTILVSAGILFLFGRSIKYGLAFDISKNILIPSVIVGSIVWNFGIQYAYYRWKLSKNPEAFKNLRVVTNYLSGIIGDAVLVPLLNVLLFSLYFLTPISSTSVLTVTIFLGTLTTAALHITQAHTGKLNWSMPSKWRWNGAGLWHMISAPVQFSFLYLVIADIFMNRQSVISNYPLIVLGIALTIVAFLITFVVDYFTEFNCKKLYIARLLLKENEIGNSRQIK